MPHILQDGKYYNRYKIFCQYLFEKKLN